MRTPPTPARRPSGRLVLLVSAAALAASGLLVTAGPASASAATPDVGLGTAAPYSVLGGQAVTNTGPSTLSGDLGVSPGTAVTGFPPGVVGGSRHSADAAAALAQSDVGIAYDDAAGRASTQAVAGDLVGRTLTDGVYTSSGPLALSGTVTFDGQGDPASVFVVQVASTLITASASHVEAVNGAQACHIYWQVGSSATLGTASTFQGTILASASVSVTTSTHVKGRALARTGAVTLDNNVFTSPDCANSTPPAGVDTTSTVVSLPSSAVTGTPVTIVADVSTSGSGVSGTVSFFDNGTLIGTAPVDLTGHASLTLPAGGSLGTGDVTATYGGSPSSAPSTSAPRHLVITPRPAASSSARSSTPARGTAAATTTAPAAAAITTSAAGTSGLASTGPRTLLPMTALAIILLILGAALIVSARARSSRRGGGTAAAASAFARPSRRR